MAVAVGHDKKSVHHNLLLSLPLGEGSGARLCDIAKPHHYIHGNTAWSSIASGMPVASLNGADQYADCLAADSVDLNIIAQDYSIVGWVYYQALGTSQIVLGRYGVDLDGWEVYLYSVNNTLSLRHHHASLVPKRTSCYSQGWTTDAWHLFGISRSGAYPIMYRNGEELAMTYDVGGLNNPDTCNRDMVIGVRYTKDMNWLKGYMQGLRVWVGTALRREDHLHIFNTERRWFV
jgi:hypothetical protein